MKKAKLPPGLNEKLIREIIAHYDNQTEDEQAAEIEAALNAEDATMMAVPNDLVPKVLKMIVRRKRPA